MEQQKTEQENENKGDSLNSNSKRNLSIQTREEYRKGQRVGAIYFKERKFKDIEYKKREIERVEEMVKKLKEDLKGLRKKTFKKDSYENWVLWVRENNKEYNIIENKDSREVKAEDKKPIKKWLCKKCNKEYTKPYIKNIKIGLVSGVCCCPYCKTPCIDLKTHLPNHTQEYIGDDL